MDPQDTTPLGPPIDPTLNDPTPDQPQINFGLGRVQVSGHIEGQSFELTLYPDSGQGMPAGESPGPRRRTGGTMSQAQLVGVGAPQLSGKLGDGHIINALGGLLSNPVVLALLSMFLKVPLAPPPAPPSPPPAA